MCYPTQLQEHLRNSAYPELLPPTYTREISESKAAMSSPTKLSIVVAGGGIAGLSFAIEASLNGQDVRLIERRSDFATYGKSHLTYISQFLMKSDQIRGFYRPPKLSYALTTEMARILGESSSNGL